MTPWKRKEVIGNATLYLGDCLEILPHLPKVDAVITDPPYPNNAGHFVGAIKSARTFLSSLKSEAIVFWSELEMPPVLLPLVAVHIWHRTNVNGRPYEPAFHFSSVGEKRRSDVLSHAAIFDGVGPGCWEYVGHPTQKPVALMEKLARKTTGLILDPFMGSGTTGVACMNLGRSFIGIEIEPKYFDIACSRIENSQRQSKLFDDENLQTLRPEQANIGL